MKSNKVFPFLIGILTFFSVDQWSKFVIGNTVTTWLLYFCIYLCVFFIYKNQYVKCISVENRKDTFLKIYLLWILICIIRGIFVAENYWEYKQLVEGSVALLLPTLIYTFTLPNVVRTVLHFWLMYILPFFVIYAGFFIVPDSYHFFLGPVLLLGCFLPIIKGKWKLMIFLLLIIMLVGDIGARSQIIKAAACLMISVAYVLSKFISKKLFGLAFALCFISPIVIMALAFTGTFNIFNMDDYVGSKYQTKSANGSAVTDDTRSFIYVEVISSAIQHNYVIQGRTPARGNDTEAFYNIADNLQSTHKVKNIKHERPANELVHTNVFTWTGLIGCMLYSILYFISSYRAVYRSKNIYIKLLGLFVAFRWAYGWVEDFNRLDIMNVSLWMMIAMCYSNIFRDMSDMEFKTWVRSVFKKKKVIKRLCCNPSDLAK
jgi:hypothetical protein